MSNSNGSSNRILNPNAREAMDRFKMVKKICPVRTANYTRNDRTAIGHQVTASCISSLFV